MIGRRNGNSVIENTSAYIWKNFRALGANVGLTTIAGINKNYSNIWVKYINPTPREKEYE